MIWFLILAVIVFACCALYLLINVNIWKLKYLNEVVQQDWISLFKDNAHYDFIYEHNELAEQARSAIELISHMPFYGQRQLLSIQNDFAAKLAEQKQHLSDIKAKLHVDFLYDFKPRYITQRLIPYDNFDALLKAGFLAFSSSHGLYISNVADGKLKHLSVSKCSYCGEDGMPYESMMSPDFIICDKQKCKDLRREERRL